MSTHALMLLALAFAYMQSYALRTINAVLAPELVRDLALSNSDLGLLTATYFLAFCAMQIPLGILLDKYGTRRVESSLLVMAALGALIFALSPNFWGLLLGRAFIGIGVSACLMGAFKTFREQFHLSWQGRLSIFMLFFGSLGALLSTKPSYFLMELIGWRSLFLGMSGTLALGAVLLWVGVPKPLPNPLDTDRMKPSYRTVLAAPMFWQSVPVYLFMVGGYLALQSLWCGPWFIERAGMSAEQSANALLSMAVIQLVSFFLIGFLVAPWASKHHQEMTVVRVAFVAALISLVAALINPEQWGLFGWMGFAFFFAANTLSQTVLNAVFPNHLVGRASTASNFLIFVGAFVLQWGVGFLVDALTLANGNRGVSLNLAMMVVAGLMFLAWLWYCFSSRGLSQRMARRWQEH